MASGIDQRGWVMACWAGANLRPWKKSSVADWCVSEGRHGGFQQKLTAAPRNGAGHEICGAVTASQHQPRRKGLWAGHWVGHALA